MKVMHFIPENNKIETTLTSSNQFNANTSIHMSPGHSNVSSNQTNQCPGFISKFFGGVGYLVVVTAKFSGKDEIGKAIYLEIPFLEPKIPPVF